MTSDEARARLLANLGGDWPAPGDLAAETESAEACDGYRRERLTYEPEPGERIAAYLLIPDGVGAERPAPGVCVWHQHAGQWHLGKSEPAGLAGDPMHHTGVALAREGYVVLCPDAIGFEEREAGYRHTGGELERFLFLKYVVAGRCLAWKNILDMRRAVDLLAARPEVDAGRLGCYGHSMGSTHAWLVGPFEPRLQAVVGNGCLPTYEAIHAHELLHCFANFVPGLHAWGDTPDIAALIAPRALHLNFGDQDAGSPIDFVRQGVARIAAAYEEAGAAEAFTHYVEAGAGHVLSEGMWERVQACFARHLRG